MWNSKAVQANTPAFIAMNPVVQSNLKKGDGIVVDWLTHALTHWLVTVIHSLPPSHPQIYSLTNQHHSNILRSLLHLTLHPTPYTKGDVSIFDSRLLHCGMPNKSSKRRVLFYFSVSKQQRWPLPNGLHGSNSIRVEDRYRYQIKDFYQ